MYYTPGYIMIYTEGEKKRRTTTMIDHHQSALFFHLQLLVYQLSPFYHTSRSRARDLLIGVHTSGKDMHFIRYR